jgi:DNA-binding transcriptional ArsR family regulator
MEGPNIPLNSSEKQHKMPNPHSKSHSNPNSETNDVFTVLSHETRLSIFLYLLIYHELTLDELSIHLGKSKSTIHHHVQKLLEAGILKEYIKPGSKVRYYSSILKKVQQEILANLNETSFENLNPQERILQIKKIFSVLTQIMLLSTSTMDLAMNHQKHIVQELEETLGIGGGNKEINLYDVLDRFPVNMGVHLLDESQYKTFIKDLAKLDKKVEDPDSTSIKPYVFFMVGLPMKDILDAKFSKKKQNK